MKCDAVEIKSQNLISKYRYIYIYIYIYTGCLIISITSLMGKAHR